MRQNPISAPTSGHLAVPIPEQGPQITILEQDIETLTELALARFPSDPAEAARIAEIRTLLAAAFDLRRAQDLHTHYIMVDHRGTRGTNDLRAAGQHLFATLETFARALRALAERYPDVAEPLPERRAPEGSGLSLETAGHNANDFS
jgi:hypothetical protein